MAAPIRLLLVEDNHAFREALQLLLELRSDVEVVAAVSSGEDAVPACRRYAPDVVLMDYRLPGLDGVQATAAVREACPAIAVICFTADVSAREAAALQVAGAVACVRKDGDLDELIGAIHGAAGRLVAAE